MTRASDFRKGDIVATPGGRSARVTGITVDEVSCVYLTDGEEVAFRRCCEQEHRSKHRKFRITFVGRAYDIAEPA